MIMIRTERENMEKIYTLQEWDFSKNKPGDKVTNEVVQYYMDMLPPAYYSSSLAQIGEPYSMRIDPDTGKTRSTYATFKGNGNGWTFCGHCFLQETEERGQEPPYIRNL